MTRTIDARRAEWFTKLVQGTIQITPPNIDPETLTFTRHDQDENWNGVWYGIGGLCTQLRDCGLTPEEISEVQSVLLVVLNDHRAQLERALEQTLSQQLRTIYPKHS